MIPALMGRKKAVSVILGMKDGGGEKVEKEESMDGLKMAAEDLIRAVASKDAAAVADAFRAAYNVLEAEEEAMEQEEG